MDLFWIAAIVIAIFVIFAIASKRKKEPGRIRLFRRRHKLFTAAERSFLGVLDQATAGRYRVFGKVRVADVLLPVRWGSSASSGASSEKLLSRGREAGGRRD